MKKTVKHNFVIFLKKKIISTKIILIAHYAGLSVADISLLRRNINHINGTVKVVKNTLARIAVQDTPYSSIKNFFQKKSSLIIFAEDPILATKIVIKFNKKYNKFIILGGIFNNKDMNLNDIKYFASIPSLDVIHSKIITNIQSSLIYSIYNIRVSLIKIISIINQYYQNK